jgi:serine/threonine protein kinase
MLDIAEGLNYLHTLNPRVIHGDLKGVRCSVYLKVQSFEKDDWQVNILITPSRRACLADFGLARARDSKNITTVAATSNKTTGTLRWQAPELLDPESDDADLATSPASDVYAYACVCYEVEYMTIPTIRILSHWIADVFR